MWGNVIDVEFLISQFADDTSLILYGTSKPLNASLQDLDFFSKISGPMINYSKTRIMWIGSKKYSEDIICPE